MKYKILSVVMFILFSVVPFSAYGAKIKYFKGRVWDNNTYRWKYIKPTSKGKARRLKVYYAVQYGDNDRIKKVTYPLPSWASRRGRGKSVEYYNSRQKVRLRENYVGRKKLGYYKFTYDSKGKPTREDYYIKSSYLVKDGYIINKKTKKKEYKLVLKTRERVKFTFRYYYKGRHLSKIACYTGKLEKNQPVGIWLYFNPKGQIIKKEKYVLDRDVGKGKLQITKKLGYYPNGQIKTLQSFVDKKAFGNWLFYNSQGKLIRKDEFVDGLLLRRYKYSYRSSGDLDKAKLYEYNQLVEVHHYDSKGRVFKADLYRNKKLSETILYDSKGRIKERKSHGS